MIKINTFFLPVSAARRDAQWRLESVNFSEKLAKKAEESKIREEKRRVLLTWRKGELHQIREELK